MNTKSKLLPIILCGGTGSRLWPLSRRSLPKQYLSMRNKKNSSFLQNTIQRIKGLENYESPIIVCNEEHRFITAEQLRQINIKTSAIILEPSSKNTAPAIATAALHTFSESEDPILLILPSDHLIKNNRNFLDSIENGRLSALKGFIVTFGIKPNNPATGYGYIKSEEYNNGKTPKPYQIKEFIEKPKKELAEKFIRDKN